MAKRRIRAAELAGLAALGAFGYNFFGPGRDRKPGERPASEVPVEDRGRNAIPIREREVESDMPFPEMDMAQGARIRRPAVSDAQQAAAIREGQNVSAGELAALAAEQNAMLRGYDEMYANRAQRAAQAAAAQAAPGAGAAAAPAAGIRSLINDREHVFDAPMRPAARRAVINDRENVFDPRAAGPLTREEAISSIPGQSARAPQGGERVSGNQFTRNVGNILNAPVPAFIPVGRAVRGGTVLRQAPDAVPALPAPQARLAGPSKGVLKEAERTARQERLRDQVRRENAANYGLDPNAPGYAAAVRALTRELGGKDFTLKKKGGAVKAKPQKMASGGMSSASKRGDGIATKGKTKCKMY
jgi:hypothetical protein